MKHSEITDLILKAWNSTAIAGRQLGLEVCRQAPLKVYFDGHLVGEYVVDQLVNNLVIVELKAVRTLAEEHEAQLLNYLKATPYEVGLLLNFGPQPQTKRKVFDNTLKGNLSWHKPQ